MCSFADTATYHNFNASFVFIVFSKLGVPYTHLILFCSLKGNELIQYDPLVLPNTDLFDGVEELFANDDQRNLKRLIANKSVRNEASPDGLHTPSVYVDANPAEAAKFKWNVN